MIFPEIVDPVQKRFNCIRVRITMLVDDADAVVQCKLFRVFFEIFVNGFAVFRKNPVERMPAPTGGKTVCRGIAHRIHFIVCEKQLLVLIRM